MNLINDTKTYMKKTKITCSLSGVIPTGDYENLRPTFAIEEEYSEKIDVSKRIDSLNKLLHEIIKIQNRYPEPIAHG